MNDNFHVDMNEYLPLRDVVFRTLRKAILKGELKPGERLLEIQLADKLGVSRTPVREAIRKLELEGLVRMMPRRGAVVAEITVGDLEDVLEVRTALEALAVRKACLLITEEELRELKKAANEFKRCLDEGENVLACVEADIAFHEIIYGAAHNLRLQQMLQNLREQMYRYRLEYLKDRSMYKKLVEEHDAIRRALKKHDMAKAASAMRDHIVNQKDFMVESLTKTE